MVACCADNAAAAAGLYADYRQREFGSPALNGDKAMWDAYCTEISTRLRQISRSIADEASTETGCP
jgi:hypothetical protein